jgi:preprotein translocase subunit SecA
MNVCFEKAGELCKGRGYDLVSREGQVVPFGTASVNQYGGLAVVSQERHCLRYSRQR